MRFEEFDQLLLVSWGNRDAGKNFLVHFELGHFDMNRLISVADWNDLDLDLRRKLRKEAYHECIKWLEE